MSLYVGHLSPHVRQEELERVFRRFGQCNVRLKDGYGFVIYEVTADAEKALRSLRGKVICGEQISLNWSNRQPRPFQRSARSTKFYEPYHGRNFKDEYNGVGMRGSQDHRGFNDSSRFPAHNRGGHHLDDVLDKEAGGKGVSSKEGVINEGGTGEMNPVENDRWGEPARDTSTGHEVENVSDFDRYEPYHGYNRRNEKENNRTANSSGSPNRGSSQEKGQREYSVDNTERNFDKSKPPQGCYNCGLVGHIMRNCPHGDSRREKFSRFNHRRDEINFRGRGEGRVKGLRSNSWGRPNSSRDPLISRRPTWDRMECYSGKARRVRKSESFPESREKSRPKPKAVSQDKRKRKLKHGTPKKVLKKKRARRSGTSSPSSDSSTSSSQSHPKSSTSGTSRHSGSRSSSQSRSASSSSRSVSIASHSKSLSSRSRSKSRSRSRLRSRSSSLRSLSLSFSLEHKTPSSPENIPASTSPKSNLAHVPSPESKLPSRANFENSETIGIYSTLKDENTFTALEVDCKTNGDYPGNDGVIARYSANKVGDERNISCTDTRNENDVTSENHGEKSDLQRAMSVDLNMHGPVRCEASYATKISTQEMVLALRHYGLAMPEEGKSNVSVEGYFGAARMWPWEMIYYRRLKKGPISTENYARRLEQNREFGIVDKYIRSSSGWGECHQNDS